MAVSPVLVDSSWYIRLARERRDPLADLALIGAQRDIATCGLIRCEVARGIRREKHLTAFRKAWDLMVYVPTNNRLWQDAEHTLRSLDRQGLKLPLTDVVIACCARQIGAVVLTFDAHFQSIPGIKAVYEII